MSEQPIQPLSEIGAMVGGVAMALAQIYKRDTIRDHRERCLEKLEMLADVTADSLRRATDAAVRMVDTLESLRR